ncbi:thymidine phosphorylase [bacterium]|nr:thymidine phosphorylase [bacterium]
MLFTEIIRKTQHKEVLSKEEITWFTNSYASNKIPDYQMSAWLMAAYINGISKTETLNLTTAIRNSGRTLDWTDKAWFQSPELVADKHSTGGVGDKVSLILVPLALHFGLRVPMMSGRSLGHTGGTVDKLESIPGFSLFLNEAQLNESMGQFGAAMICQTEDLCPADKKLYALRDVTSTIDCVELITASIVSKKWAEGVGTIVYDVKFGSAAFMDTLERARTLAASLVEVSKQAGMRASAMITRMAEPLGSMVGNRSEVKESLWILKNEYPSTEEKNIAHPLAHLCCQMAAKMALLAGTRNDYKAATKEAIEYLESGKGYEVFLDLSIRQGARQNWEKDFTLHPAAWILSAKEDGWIKQIDSKKLGLSGLELGMGRATKDDIIDPKAAFQIHTKIGNSVKKGDKILTFFGEEERLNASIIAQLEGLVEISKEKVLEKEELLVETLD